ncbi:hypothetical protein ACHAW6_011248 [Cyclotella cf. meneghiniana]
MKSLSDSSRVALLGLAFECSRFLARGLLEALSSTFEIRPDATVDVDETVCCCKNDHIVTEKCRISGRIPDDGGHDDSYMNKFIEIFKQFKQVKRIPRYIAMSSWLLLSPPILLLCNRRLCNAEKYNSSNRATYLSSIVTSIGILFFLYPDITSNNNTQVGGSSFVIVDGHDSTENTVDDSKLQAFNEPLALLPQKEQNNQGEVRLRSDSLLSQMTESSVTSQSMIIPSSDKAIGQKKYLEILVHNVSHTDLILGLSDGRCEDSSLIQVTPRMSADSSHNTPRTKNSFGNNDRDGKSVFGEEKYVLCRPRFSAFDMFSRRVKSELSSHSTNIPLQNRIISYPQYERSSATARYTLVTPRPSDQYMLPVGFNLERVDSIDNSNVDQLLIDANDMPSLRVRGRDIARIDPALFGDSPRRMSVVSPLPSQWSDAPCKTKVMDTLRINAVFFPLLSTLLPRWLGQIADRFGGTDVTVSKSSKSANVKKVVVLVSGVGSPRNWTHSISGNSTQVCADLMELFIHELFPDVTVIKIHSQTNIFRYDENISFATDELMPCIDAYRDAHARSEPYPDEIHSEKISDRNLFNPDWRHTVSVSYSFADGSAARTHAIQAALRPYRPTYFHFWQLKTFWHDSKITTEDIEVHSFEEMETVPAIAVDQTSGEVLKVINEMNDFRRDFLETVKEGGRSDLASFWLRKTKKPVLAVLLVQKPNGEQMLYRGTNMEVSMPTGSLCAERNVIGTALATDPSLKREDLVMVAVLSVQLPMPSPPPGPPLCRPTSESLNLMIEVKEKLKLQPRNELHRSTSVSSIAEANIADEWEMEYDSGITSPPRMNDHLVDSPSADDAVNLSGSSTPKRHISLYKFADPKSKTKLNRRPRHLGGIAKNKKRLLLVQSPEDINPLKPCGACNEWLKKIAEANPHFKVLTFTDALCNGVYVSPCQD